jgi:hypothetical protein
VGLLAQRGIFLMTGAALPLVLGLYSTEGFLAGVGHQDAELSATAAGFCDSLALGLLPPELDLRAMLFDVLGEQVVGYYDTEQKRLVLRDDSLAALMRRDTPDVGEGRMVVVHESIHALQDQHFDLHAEHERPHTIDEANAFRALVEGDATLAMIGHQAQQLGASLRDPRLLESIRRAFIDRFGDAPDDDILALVVVAVATAGKETT